MVLPPEFQYWQTTQVEKFQELAIETPVATALPLQVSTDSNLVEALKFYQANSNPIRFYQDTPGDIDEVVKAIVRESKCTSGAMGISVSNSMLEVLAKSQAALAAQHCKTMKDASLLAATMATGDVLWRGFPLTPGDTRWELGKTVTAERFASYSFNVFCGMHYACGRARNLSNGKPAILRLEVKGAMRVYPLLGLPSEYSWQEEVIALPGLQMEVVDRYTHLGQSVDDALEIIHAETR